MLALNQQLTAEQRIAKAVVDITAHERYIALAGVLMIGTKTVSDDIPTACTNGRDVEFGRAMVDELTDAELRFVMLHEDEGHKLLRHLTTYRWMYDIDPGLANQACDTTSTALLWMTTVETSSPRCLPASTKVCMTRSSASPMDHGWTRLLSFTS